MKQPKLLGLNYRFKLSNRPIKHLYRALIEIHIWMFVVVTKYGSSPDKALI